MNRVTRWIATNLLGGDELRKATWEAAEENLAFAEDRAPEIADHHLQLARLYHDTGRPELALRELEHVVEVPAVTALELAVRAEAMALREELGS
jgi:Tfp pilus assembly protein PilF